MQTSVIYHNMTDGLGLSGLLDHWRIQDEAAVFSRVNHLPAMCTVVISALVVPVARTTPRANVLFCGVVWPELCV